MQEDGSQHCSRHHGAATHGCRLLTSLTWRSTPPSKSSHWFCANRPLNLNCQSCHCMSCTNINSRSTKNLVVEFLYPLCITRTPGATGKHVNSSVYTKCNNPISQKLLHANGQRWISFTFFNNMFTGCLPHKHPAKPGENVCNMSQVISVKNAQKALINLKETYKIDLHKDIKFTEITCKVQQ